ncbi:MAG: lamin tail domain-containing protein [Byssovorax sp.]
MATLHACGGTGETPSGSSGTTSGTGGGGTTGSTTSTTSTTGAGGMTTGTGGQGGGTVTTGAGGMIGTGGGPVSESGLCGKKVLDTWSRKGLSTGAAVLFNEVMYHPQKDASLEWIELYNPLGIDVDLSGFQLAGAVTFTFPEGTFLGGRSYLVVAADAALFAQSTGKTAVGSYSGLLPNDHGTIELRNNAGRLLDAMTYDDRDPWPVIADGSGASLAKRAPATASPDAESWTASLEVGGTPGAPNFASASPSAPPLTLVPLDASWRYRSIASPPPANWEKPGFDDSTWPSAPATFYAGGAAGGAMPVSALFTADNYVALYRGKADGTNLTFLGRDAVGDWTSAESFPFQAAADDYLYVAAWEAPGDTGGPQMMIGEVALPGGAVLPTATTTFEWILGPAGQSPGGALNDPPPPVATLQGLIQAANAAGTWADPQVSADKSSPPWNFALDNVFTPGTQYIWPDTFGDVSITNANNTYALFRTKGPILPSKGTTKLDVGPITSYFRTHFQAPANLALVQPWIDELVDDGAVFYLNGKEVLRTRMPNGAVGYATLASSSVIDAALEPGNLVDSGAIVPGDNLLAVEVHQALNNDPDMTFAAQLASTVKPPSPGDAPHGLAFNEISAGGAGFWVELANLGSAPVALDGYVITTSGGGEKVLPPGTLDPGSIALLGAADLGFGAAVGAKVFLYTPDRAAVLDGAEVGSVPRARSSAGPWRYPDESTPGAPNVFMDQAKVAINEVMYHAPPVVAPDGSIQKSTLEWIELLNYGNTPVDVGGYQLVDAIEYALPAGTMIPPSGFLVVAKDAAAMMATYPSLSGAGPDKLLGNFKGTLADGGENLVLLDACGNPVDQVHYQDGGRFPALADGGGSSLERRDPRSPGDAGESWGASDEASASAWQLITYQGVAQPSSVGPDGQYQEFVIGLLDAGTVLLDDISVIENPNTSPVELIQNGTFESGTAAAWRLLGNHRHAEVVTDPTQPQNHVLRLSATGPTEHMHNHLETTLKAGKTIKNGTTYKISLRAKWEGGENKLNTRLYFNRLAMTTALPLPPFHGTPGGHNSRAADNQGPTYQALSHAPVNPKPGEPVVVSVRATDPDGVTSMTLWYSVNGGAPQSMPMSKQGGDLYTALLPGGAASSIVQFWAEGQDGLGEISTFPAQGPASRALFRVDGGPSIPAGLHPLRIVMAPSDMAFLFDQKNLMSNDPVPGTVIDDDQEAIYDVGIRLKGSERGRPEVVRLGFALDFPPERPFRGVHSSIMVDRSEGVSFGQRELFFNQAMNHAGSVHSQYDDLMELRPPLAAHNGSTHLQLARFGNLLLDGQFDQGSDGMLFEYELIYFPLTTDTGTPQGYKLPQPDSVIGTSIHDLGDDPENYRLPFILKNNRFRDDYRGLIAFAKFFGTGGPAFNAKAADMLDVDEWLRAFAFATLSGTVDNYGVGDAHNGNFYIRPTDSKAIYFPHDLDFYGGSPQSAVVASGDLGKLISQPDRLRAYYGHLYDIITTSYNATYMAHWSQELGGLLPGQDFAGHLQFVAARSAWVLNGAPNAVTKAIPKVAFAISTNGGAPLAVMTPDVTLAGVGWVDVSEVRAGGVSVPVVWTGQAAWQVTLPLMCGLNAVQLDAFDRHGAAVGSDSIDVTRSGGGCP